MESDFENIVLDKNVIAELYADCLVAINPSTLTNKAIGKNEKNILILVDDEENIELTANKYSLLQKILAACQLSMDDVALVNYKAQNSLNDLINSFKPTAILSFNISPKSLDLPIDFPQYQVQTYLQMKLLCLPSLDEIGTNVAAKKSTWESLKKMFAISK